MSAQHLARTLCAALASVFCLMAAVATAQSYNEALRLEYLRSPVFDADDAVQGINRWYANINFATPIKPDKTLFLASYEGRALSFDFAGERSLPTVYSNRLGLGAVHLWDDKKWRLLWLANAKINSDYEDITFDQDWQFGGTALLTLTKSEDLAFTIGGYYNSEFFGPFFIPILGVSWQPKPRWFVYVLAPQQARVEYALKPRKLYVGFQANLFVSSYRLSEAFQNDYIEERFIDLNLFLDYYLTKNLVLFVQTGYPARLRYKYFSADDVELLDDAFPFVSRANFNLKAGIAFQIRQKN